MNATAEATGTLAHYICKLNAHFAETLNIDFRWASLNPEDSPNLTQGVDAILNEFVFAARKRATRTSALQIRFEETESQLTATSRYFLSATDDSAKADFDFLSHAPESLRSRLSVDVQKYAYWEEARLTLRLD